MASDQDPIPLNCPTAAGPWPCASVTVTPARNGFGRCTESSESTPPAICAMCRERKREAPPCLTPNPYPESMSDDAFSSPNHIDRGLACPGLVSRSGPCRGTAAPNPPRCAITARPSASRRRSSPWGVGQRPTMGSCDYQTSQRQHEPTTTTTTSAIRASAGSSHRG